MSDQMKALQVALNLEIKEVDQRCRKADKEWEAAKSAVEAFVSQNEADWFEKYCKLPEIIIMIEKYGIDEAKQNFGYFIEENILPFSCGYVYEEGFWVSSWC